VEKLWKTGYSSSMQLVENPPQKPENHEEQVVRRGPGRPKKDRPVDKEASKLREQHTLPVPPGSRLTFDGMQTYFKLLTPEMWTHIACYLYRIRPRIIRQLRDPNSPNYIDCIGQPFDMDYIIDRHGGGRYLLEVNNADAPREKGEGQKNNRGHLFSVNFDVDEVRYAPKLDYSELDLNHRENISYLGMLRAKGILDSTGKPVQPNTQPPSNGLNADVLKEVLGLVRSLTSDQQEQLRTRLAASDNGGLTKSIGDILVERMKQDDPSKQFAVMSSVVTAVKEMVAANKPADNNGMYQSIITMMAEDRKAAQANATEQRKTDLEYLRLIIDSTNKTTEKTSDFGQFKEVFGFAREIMSLTSRNTGERSGWEAGLDLAREILPQGLGVLNTFLMGRRGAAAPGQPGAAPASFDPYRNPDAARAYANSLRQPQPGQPGGAAPGQSPFAAGAAPAGLMQVVQQYGELVVNALNQGTPGYDFADYLCGLLGTGTHAAIAQQGEDPIVQALMSIPQIALFGEQRVRTFTHEFIHFEQLLKEQQAAEEQEAAATV
jgi:hypothetical protein